MFYGNRAQRELVSWELKKEERRPLAVRADQPHSVVDEDTEPAGKLEESLWRSRGALEGG